jgi:FkbM family methyltransferase
MMEHVALTEWRARYLRNELSKHEYAHEMKRHHASLREHAELLADSDIAVIEIRPHEVTLVSRFDGARFPCDPTDRSVPPVVALDFGAYEAKDFAMVRALVPRGGTFVDIGANIGWYSVHVALADPTAKVIAVEPIPRSYHWLTTAIQSNAITNVIPLNMAVASAPAEIELWIDSALSGAASTSPSTGKEGLERIACRASTIDDVVAAHGGEAHFIKLDIEGAELHALRGARGVLARLRPIVFAEMLRKLTRPYGYHPNDIIELMRDHGYGCFRAVGTTLVGFDRMNDETAETNFYFLHSEAHREVAARWVRSA